MRRALHLICVGATVAMAALAVPRPAQAQLDALTNVGACVVTGFAAGVTTIAVNTGCGATLPGTAFNVSVCNTTDYPIACRTTAGVRDPNYEVVRVTAGFGTDSLTITRAQESTADVAHNTGGKTYWINTHTAKTVSDTSTALGATFLTTSTNSVLTNEAVLTGTANQVILTGSTLSTPQNIHTAATPTFGALTVSTATNPGFLHTSDVQAVGVSDTYSSSTASAFRFRRGRGTAAVPLRAQDADPLGFLHFGGWYAVDNTTTAVAWQTTAIIQGIATDNYSATARGSSLVFSTQADGGVAGVATRLTLTESALTMATGVALFGATNGEIYPGWGTNTTAFFPTTGRTNGQLSFSDSTHSNCTGAYRCQTSASIFPHTDATTNYYDGHLMFGLTGDSSTYTGVWSLGHEGRWTSGGGWTERRLYAFDQVDNATVWFVDTTDKHAFKLGYPLTSPSTETGYSMWASGRLFNNTEATAGTIPTGTIGGLLVHSLFETNNADVRTWPVARIRPTINFGGANTTKTIDLLEIDSVNTAVTGATVNLLRASYGGAQRAIVTSPGHVKFSGANASTLFTDAAGTSRTALVASDHTVTDFSFATPLLANLFVVHTDWASDPGSKAVNGIHSSVTTAADAIAQASVTLRGVAPGVTHNGTGTLNAMIGSGATVTNASTGTVTTAEGARGSVTNSNAAGVITTGYSLRAIDLTNAGTVGSYYGVWAGDVSAGTQTNTPFSFFAPDTAGPSNFNATVNIGGGATAAVVPVRTTEGTNQLKMFNGTAPAGTLANGTSLYSASGELRVLDAAGLEAMLSPHTKALTDNTVIDVLSLTAAASAAIGGMLTYTIEVFDGTDIQMETGQLLWSGVNKAAAFTVAVTEVNTQQSVSAGTLTTAWTISSANPAVISVNANSSLTPSAGYPRITFRVADNLSRQAFTLP